MLVTLKREALEAALYTGIILQLPALATAAALLASDVPKCRTSFSSSRLQVLDTRLLFLLSISFEYTMSAP